MKSTENHKLKGLVTKPVYEVEEAYRRFSEFVSEKISSPMKAINWYCRFCCQHCETNVGMHCHNPKCVFGVMKHNLTQEQESMRFNAILNGEDAPPLHRDRPETKTQQRFSKVPKKQEQDKSIHFYKNISIRLNFCDGKGWWWQTAFNGVFVPESCDDFVEHEFLASAELALEDVKGFIDNTF